MNIIFKPIKYNFTRNPNRKIEYIVIHDTGNPRAGANAERHYIYFNGGNRGASAHFFVDDKEIIQTVRDSDVAWGVGDGEGRYGITNTNSLNIEMCINSDGDFTKTLNSTVELTKHLMDKHKIVNDKVVRHFDASRKNCPAILNNPNWQGWIAFKNMLRTTPSPEVKHQPHWAEPYYKYLTDNGITIHEKRFDDRMTRGEVFALLARMKGYK